MRNSIRLFSWFRASVLPIGLAVLTLALGSIGWFKKDFDGTTHSAVIVAFKVLGNFTPSYKNLGEGNVLTDIAALSGLLTIYASALMLAGKVLREWRRKMVARWLSRDHVVVIGDSELAHRVQMSWEENHWRPLQIIAADATKSVDWTARQVRHSLDEDLEKAFSLRRARRVFIDLGDDALTFSLALRLLLQISKRATSQIIDLVDREWIVVGCNTDLADRFFARFEEIRSQIETSGCHLPIVHQLDPAHLAVRHVLSSNPLFLQAQELRQTAVHAMIVGSGVVARHLIESICLMSPTTELGLPSVTIISDKSDSDRDSFFAGRPTLATAIDICFLDTAALSGFTRSRPSSAPLLLRRHEISPITAVFVASENAIESLSKMTLVERFCREIDHLDLPIFCYSENPDGSNLICSQGGDRSGFAASIFGLSDAALEAQIVDSEKRDKLAKALHAYYASRIQNSSQHVYPWYRLPESLRRANRNAADHWRAKMHSFGFDVRRLPCGALPGLSKQEAEALLRGAEVEASAKDHALFRAIARIEHERWRIERLIDGWEYDTSRDDRRRTHPSLIPWEKLEDRLPAEFEKCLDQVKALIDCLSRLRDSRALLIRNVPKP